MDRADRGPLMPDPVDRMIRHLSVTSLDKLAVADGSTASDGSASTRGSTPHGLVARCASSYTLLSAPLLCCFVY